MTAWGRSFIPNGKNKQVKPKTEVIPRTGLQEEPVPFSGASSFAKGGSYLRGLQETSDFILNPRLPVRAEAAGTPRPFRSPLFPVASLRAFRGL